MDTSPFTEFFRLNNTQLLRRRTLDGSYEYVERESGTNIVYLRDTVRDMEAMRYYRLAKIILPRRHYLRLLAGARPLEVFKNHCWNYLALLHELFTGPEYD